METWRPIPAAPGYEASSLGRVRRVGGEVISAELNATGYASVLVERTVPTSVHFLVANAFYGDRRGRLIRHLNGDPDDNRPDNLRYGTYQENADDRAKHGRTPWGSVPVRCVPGVNGETETRFPSIAEAVRRTGVYDQEIRAVLRGRQNKAGGYHWYTCPKSLTPESVTTPTVGKSAPVQSEPIATDTSRGVDTIGASLKSDPS